MTIPEDHLRRLFQTTILKDYSNRSFQKTILAADAYSNGRLQIANSDPDTP